MKREIALNKLFNLFIFLGVVCGLIARVSISEADKGFSIGFSIATIAFIVFPVLFMPCCYLFDAEGVTLKYVFFTNERYLWKNIHKITVEYDGPNTTKGGFFTLFYSHVFQIKGKNENENKFYMEGKIRKSFRTKYLLEKYWDGTITGYFFENAKKRFNIKKEKNKTHLTDEIVPMEREARAKARALIEPLLAKANQYGYVLSYAFIYVTDDLKESRSRPKEDYTYSMLVKVNRNGDPREKEVELFSIELLYVHLGKTKYRGAENKNLETQLNTTDFYLDEVIENGIEAYQDDN